MRLDEILREWELRVQKGAQTESRACLEYSGWKEGDLSRLWKLNREREPLEFSEIRRQSWLWSPSLQVRVQGSSYESKVPSLPWYQLTPGLNPSTSSAWGVLFQQVWWMDLCLCFFLFFLKAFHNVEMHWNKKDIMGVGPDANMDLGLGHTNSDQRVVVGKILIVWDPV